MKGFIERAMEKLGYKWNGKPKDEHSYGSREPQEPTAKDKPEPLSIVWG